MDSRRFDALAKSLAGTDTRRRIVRLLAVLPLGVTLTSVFGDGPDATAKKKKQQTDDDHGSSHRRHRRKAKHRHQTGNNKEHRKGKRKGKRKGSDPGNDPGTTATSCTKRTCTLGVCGSQSDGCGGTMRCGCGTNQLCDEGTCRDCTVICPGGSCLVATLQPFLNGPGPVYVCPGRYIGTFTIDADIEVIGAGQGTDAGDDPAVDTILDAQNTGRVVEIGAGRTVTLRN